MYYVTFRGCPLIRYSICIGKCFPYQKKDTLQPYKEWNIKFRGRKIRRFRIREKTCDELVKRFWQSPSLLSPSDLSNDASSSTGTESTIINDHVQTQDEQNHPILQLEMSPKMRRIPIQQSDFKSKLPWFAKLKSEVDIAALFLQIQRTKTLFIASKNNNKIAGKLDCWDCQILQFTSKRQF